MKHIVFFTFLLVCFSIFSCSHNPYSKFQEIQIGDEKSEVLDKVGSPLRSRFQNGKNIWTYRLYSKDSGGMVYKDVILDTEKVLEIRSSKEVDVKEIEKKESLVEQSLKETKASPSSTKVKPAIDDSIINDSAKKRDDSTFAPVEPTE